MKNRIITALFAGFAFISCGEKKIADGLSTEAKDSTEVVNTTTEKEEVAAPHIRVTGTVMEIQQGKDGVTARIKDSDGKFYAVTISIPNLKEPEQYREVKVDDVITVSGEQWEMDGETHIKANTLEI